MYGIPMKTLNIRLGPAEADAVKQLRRAGENVSDLLRQVLIIEASKKRSTSKSSAELLAELDAIYDAHPGPTPDYIKKGIDTTNRAQMSAYMRDRIRRKKGRAK